MRWKTPVPLCFMVASLSVARHTKEAHGKSDGYADTTFVRFLLAKYGPLQSIKGLRRGPPFGLTYHFRVLLWKWEGARRTVMCLGSLVLPHSTPRRLVRPKTKKKGSYSGFSTTRTLVVVSSRGSVRDLMMAAVPKHHHRRL